jgi:acetylornithine deacetylase/succinyl-diaminopimelate desuccinylase-like protein
MQTSDLLSPQTQHDLPTLAGDLVRIKSLSGQEGEIIRFIESRMPALGFDEVRLDAMGTLRRISWTGLPVACQPIHPAWKIDPQAPLAQSATAAYRQVFGGGSPDYDFWDFSTNAVTPVSLGLPSLGFGPGEYKLAHMRDEKCALSQILDACRFYTSLIGQI